MRSVIVKKIGKKGLGVFAQKDFSKGNIILRIDTSDKIPKKDEDKLTNYQWDHLGSHGYKKYYHMKPPEKFVNHSCDPNSFDRNGVLFAIRKIKKGEEITIDYSINGVEIWKMVCKCGSKTCRKIITGKFNKLPAKLQKKYRPYMEDWFIEKEKRLK